MPWDNSDGRQFSPEELAEIQQFRLQDRFKLGREERLENMLIELVEVRRKYVAAEEIANDREWVPFAKGIWVRLLLGHTFKGKVFSFRTRELVRQGNGQSQHTPSTSFKSCHWNCKGGFGLWQQTTGWYVIL